MQYRFLSGFKAGAMTPIVISLVGLLFSNTVLAADRVRVSQMEFIGEATVAIGTMFEDTEIGGLYSIFPSSQSMIGGRVAIEAHLYGIVSGFVWALSRSTPIFLRDRMKHSA